MQCLINNITLKKKLDMIKNVEDAVVFLKSACFYEFLRCFLILQARNASHFCRKAANENIQFEETKQE